MFQGRRSGFPSFAVNHFNLPVTYSSEGFLDRNRDAINPDYMSLLRGATDALEGTGSINPFIKGLFSTKAITMRAHLNEDAIVAAQQAVKPMRAASTRRKITIKHMRTVKEALGLDIEERDGRRRDHQADL